MCREDWIQENSEGQETSSKNCAKICTKTWRQNHQSTCKGSQGKLSSKLAIEMYRKRLTPVVFSPPHHQSNHKPRQNEGKENSYPSKVVTVLSDTEDEEETTVFSSSARLLQEMVIDLKTRERMNENSLRLAQSTIKKLETDLEISNAAKADKAKDLGNALQNNAFLSEENKTLQTAVGHLNQALAASKASLVSEKAEKEQALRSAFEVSETLAQANSRVDRLKSENASLSRQLSVTTEELNRMKSAKLASDETASDAQLQIEKLNSALAEAASKYNELEASFSHEKLVSYALASKLAPARDKDTTTSGPPDTSFTTSKVSNQSVEGSSQKNTPFHDPDNQTIVKMKAMTATLKAMTATLTANAQTKASKANLTPEVVQKRPTALNQMDKKKTE